MQVSLNEPTDQQDATSGAPSRRLYGGSDAVDPLEPGWRWLPADRGASPGFERLRTLIYSWIGDYYDAEHLTRAGDWMLALAPEAPDHLVLAALLHDVERKIPGGPRLDIAATPWDDRAYNDAHSARSSVVAQAWLTINEAHADTVLAVAQPIREHEFGGSPEGDLMQAADSISFLETNAGLVAGWASSGRCSDQKAEEKLRWMGERVRHAEGRRIAKAYMERAMDEFQALRRTD